MSLGDYYFHKNVIARTPLYHLDLKDADFETISNDSAFLEALMLASPDLFAKLGKLQEGKIAEPDERAGVVLAIRKYWNRICTRTVPFGTFASTGILSWTEPGHTPASVTRQSAWLKSRLDMDFLNNYAAWLEGLPEVQEFCRYFPNKTLHQLGGEYRYLECLDPKKRSGYKVAATNATKHLEFIISKAKKGKTFDRLIDDINQLDPTIPREEARDYLNALRENQVLISELEPSVTGKEYQYIIHGFLEQAINQSGSTLLKTQYEQFSRLVTLLSDSSAGIGEKDRFFSEFQSSVRDLGFEVPLSRLIQTDAFHSFGSSQLNRQIQNNLTDGIKACLAFAKPTENENLKNFRRRFLERYDRRMVPLSEVMDPETGLGYPNPVSADISELTEGFDFTEAALTSTTWDDQERWYLEKLSQALKKDEYSIKLTTEDLERFPTPHQKMAPSMSVMFRVTNLEDNSIEMQSVWGSSAANILGRFTHGSEEIKDLAIDITSREQALNSDVVFAEIAHLPESRVGNILQRPTLRPYEISFLAKASVDEKHEIAINDLWIQVVSDRFELWSRKLGKRIIPRLSTAHNYGKSYLPAYKFLCDLQAQEFLAVPTFSWGSVGRKFQFLPRVEFKKAVLHPATWNLQPKDFLYLQKFKSGEDMIQAVEEFRRRWQLPRLVLHAEGDNELLIDFSKEHDIRMWLDAIKNRQKATLKEFLWTDKSGVRDSTGALYRNQFVASLISKEPRYRASLGFNNTRNVQRTFAPGTEWLYYKIFCGERLGDHILTHHMWPLIQELVAEDIIDQFFFIRFNENGHHLRLRFHAKRRLEIGSIMTRFSETIGRLEQANISWKTEIGTYQREIERYGANTIEIAERIFFYDSIAALKLLTKISGDEGEELRWQWLLALIDDLFDTLGFSIEHRLEFSERNRQLFFNEFGASKDLKLKADRKFRKYQPIIETVLNIGFSESYAALSEILEERKQKIGEVTADLIRKLDEGSRLSLDSFASSIIHMEVNRTLTSRQRFYEFLLYTFLSKHYKSALARSKKQSKKAPPILKEA